MSDPNQPVQPAPKTTHQERKPGRISGFIGGVSDLIKRNPIMSLASGVLVFFFGWFGETVLDKAYSSFFPDPDAVRAQILREQIATRTDNIAQQLQKMEANISDIGAGDDQAAIFLEAAETVMRELDSLRPEISQFAQQADRAAARLASAKESELATTGQSAAADFVLPVSGAVTLCPQRFVVGVNRTGTVNGGSDGGARFVDISLDRLGEATKTRLLTGRGARLDSDSNSVVVQYLGPLEENSLHQFNFKCL